MQRNIFHRAVSYMALKFNKLIRSDKAYIKLKYWGVMGEKINLEDPKTFNEKLQWLKLNCRRPEFTIMADKYRVREYIAEKLGEEYLIPLLGVWDSPDDIDFKSLPNQFVLKCNHNSGLGLCVCRDKSNLDIERTKKLLEKGLKEDYYLTNREWVYKDIPRKIVAEQYMVDGSGQNELTDYKFYCFNGKPEYLYVSHGLENHETATISFLNLDWTFADFGRSDYAPYKELPPKPVNLDKMIEFAEILSKDIPFLRVDLYEINQRIYFGELTFYPSAGMMPFSPKDADLRVGELLKIQD